MFHSIFFFLDATSCSHRDKTEALELTAATPSVSDGHPLLSHRLAICHLGTVKKTPDVAPADAASSKEDTHYTDQIKGIACVKRLDEFFKNVPRRSQYEENN